MSRYSAHYSTTQKILLNITSVLVLIPLAPYMNRFMPTLQIGEWNLDLVVSMIITFLITRFILLLFKPLIIPALVVVLGVLTWNHFTHNYSFSNVFEDYKSTVQRNWITREEKQTDILSLYPRQMKTGMDKTVEEIRSKMDYKDSVVRNFAVKGSLAYFEDYYSKFGENARLLSLFKYIRLNFRYVPDAKRDEYFATPRETILNGLGGDCDDHAILMASCMRAIGGITRIVLVKGHAYPELYCGDKKGFEDMKSAIIQLFNDLPIEKIYFHEYDDNYWINLDYTAMHPGGPYMNDEVKAVVEW